jgi:hypothetical protein
MGHPDGGKGNVFSTVNTFEQAYAFVGIRDRQFLSIPTPRKAAYEITAKHGLAEDGVTETIVFVGHGNVCEACWGFRKNCSGTRIGHCVVPLDRIIRNVRR